MTYEVRLTRRVLRDLARIYRDIKADVAVQAVRWFDGLEKAISSLEEFPDRAPTTPEDSTFRHLLYGRKPHVYRIIYEVEERTATVSVLHIRYGARDRILKR